ncbi:TetR family transcriptional regulator [Plantactinospora solaniradicis]|uniref:TetR family transcriptional regulator n=1 Tax=Plantactinospora solaniradicis TaxID=1723736 RepID=A0ABW1KJ95_9ACTN
MTAPNTNPPGLRERTRNAMRAEIAATAVDLFISRGFERTTVDEVVAATGVARRTFFRYFDTKEDLVLGYLADMGDLICGALAARPAAESVWEALRRAMDDAKRVFVSDPERLMAIFRLCGETPSLRARHAEKIGRWHGGITEELGRRMGVDPAVDLRPATFAAAALGALDAVGAAWSGGRRGDDLDVLLDEAFDALRGPAPGTG